MYIILCVHTYSSMWHWKQHVWKMGLIFSNHFGFTVTSWIDILQTQAVWLSLAYRIIHCTKNHFDAKQQGPLAASELQAVPGIQASELGDWSCHPKKHKLQKHPHWKVCIFWTQSPGLCPWKVKVQKIQTIPIRKACCIMERLQYKMAISRQASR